MKSTTGVGILGAGHALGAIEESNEALCARLSGVTPEWIVEHTGITARRLAAPEESASVLAGRAASAAAADAGVALSELDMVVAATFSGDYVFPPTATQVHRDLGLRAKLTFDLQANCTGLVTALTVAADRMAADVDLRFALVLGVEVLSPFVQRTDPETAIYFSDGAGAVVLGRVEPGAGLVGSAFHTDSSNFEAVRLRAGGSRFPLSALGPESPECWMKMNGLATWRQAVTHMPRVVRGACAKAGVQPGEVDLFVFHQANLQIIHYVMRKLGIPIERTFTNIERVGNAGAASMPIALSEAVERGRLKAGNRLVLAGVGAGFNFGASVWRIHSEWLAERVQTR